ncbi:hypothetical protein I41_24700 [Lacipirellula limnantheis]|uniref:Uncharacterized protein n=1 Tax=Lacipirellula limnantheis TaxID=2528024 RepID=A0A517TY36_9BACT|nr:hypothetical protein I41_24700 [Lacipirellula limnantheis]
MANRAKSEGDYSRLLVSTDGPSRQKPQRHELRRNGRVGCLRNFARPCLAEPELDFVGSLPLFPTTALSSGISRRSCFTGGAAANSATARTGPNRNFGLLIFTDAYCLGGNAVFCGRNADARFALADKWLLWCGLDKCLLSKNSTRRCCCKSRTELRYARSARRLPRPGAARDKGRLQLVPASPTVRSDNDQFDFCQTEACSRRRTLRAISWYPEWVCQVGEVAVPPRNAR